MEDVLKLTDRDDIVFVNIIIVIIIQRRTEEKREEECEQKHRRHHRRLRKPNPNQMLIYVPPHPLLKHWLAVARNAASPSALFRSAMAEIGKILLYELSRDWLETYEAQVQGPLAVANVEVVDPTKPISIVPILRAGLTLVEKAHEVLPTTKTYHLGYARDEKTLEATKYLDKLPKAGFSKEDKVLISDPMLATGGTIVRAVRDVLDKGADVKNVRVMCCVAAAGADKVERNLSPDWSCTPP